MYKVMRRMLPRRLWLVARTLCLTTMQMIVVTALGAWNRIARTQASERVFAAGVLLSLVPLTWHAVRIHRHMTRKFARWDARAGKRLK